jgi:hypothetical protein
VKQPSSCISQAYYLYFYKWGHIAPGFDNLQPISYINLGD